MKKILLLFILAIITPIISYASWWNPLSWFQKNNTPVAVKIVKKTQVQDFETNNPTSTKEKINTTQTDSTKSDSYIIKYNKDGTPLDWYTVDRGNIILEDSYNSYKTSLVSFKQIQAKEIQTRDGMEALMRKGNLDEYTYNFFATQINYENQYIDSADKFIGALDELVTDYSGMFKASEKRYPSIYLYYSDKIDKIDIKTLANDYQNKQEAKINYAKSYNH